MAKFGTNVFLNCPFDDDYRQMLLAAVFTVKYLGYTPRLALQNVDSAETRLAKIVDLIRKSRFGIHDLSRIMSTRIGEHYRMNMPFELGMDYACKQYKPGKWNGKKLLVLESEPFRYQAALSDLAGSDIKHHNDDPALVVKVIRDWFVTVELGRADGPTAIWYDFNDFSADLETSLLAGGYTADDYATIPVAEVMSYMDDWLNE